MTMIWVFLIFVIKGKIQVSIICSFSQLIVIANGYDFTSEE